VLQESVQLALDSCCVTQLSRAFLRNSWCLQRWRPPHLLLLLLLLLLLTALF
jgi:hypothetical protein